MQCLPNLFCDYTGKHPMWTGEKRSTFGFAAVLLENSSVSKIPHTLKSLSRNIQIECREI